ncbi:MAG TPA: vanadium-dependent haloperoxidase [Bryobacteraceae bacterium]|jgi:hypothetical protein
MKQTALLSLAFGAIVSIARPDEVTDWNKTLFQAALAAKTSPVAITRTAAIFESSVFDAVNGIDRRFTPIHVQKAGPRRACKRAAAIQAAYASLIRLYPDQKSTFDQKRAESLECLRGHRHRDAFAIVAGLEWGQKVADEIWNWRSTDGSSPAPPPFEGGPAIGVWRPTPPAFLPGALPQFATMETWVIQSHSQFRPVQGPPSLDSAQYARDFNEVKEMGSISSSTRSADETLAAQFWATSTGNYFWNSVALSLLGRHHHSLLENARLLALLNIAIADAGIVCWDAKYYFASWRPVTAIPLADQDGNPATQPDTDWTPLIVTPPFPEYPSGHSTASSAAAAVLAEYFGEHVNFTVDSDVMTGVIRRFTRFSAALDEIRSARVNGGIHYRTACNDGQLLGEEVARYVMGHSFHRLRGARDDDEDDER